MSDFYKKTINGDMPNGWKLVSISKIADVTTGGTPSTSIPEYWNGNIPWMNSGEINLRRIRDVENRITELGLNNSSTKIIKKHSVLMALAGQGKTRGKVAINEFPLCTNQSLATICNFKNADFEFIFQNLESRYIDIRKMSTGDGGRGGLNLKIIKSIKIALPPFPEQQKIANILSTVDAKIEVIAQQITETQELKKGLMQRLLTKGIGHTEFKDSPLGRIPKSWDVVKQAEVAIFYNGRAYKRTEWEESGTPVIRLQNLTGTGKDYYYSNIELPDHQYCYNGDLLYMWSATFGPVWWFGEKAIYHYHIWKIEHNSDELDRNFHYYLLDNVTTRMKNESHGSTMLHVTKGGMEKLPIQLPSLSEQKKIADILRSVDDKLDLLSAKKTTYQELKQGLMQQLLTGKVRVKLDVES